MMAPLFASIFLILVPLFLIRKPVVYLYYVFIVGLVPMSWLGSVPTPVGSLTVSAIKLLGIIIASMAGLGKRRLMIIIIRLFPFFLFFFIATISIAWSPSLSMGIRMLLKLMAPLSFGFYVAVNFEKIGERQLLKSIVISGVLSIVAALICTGGGFTKSHFGLAGSSRAVFSSHLTVVVSVMAAYAVVFRKMKFFAGTGLVSLAILMAFTRITILGMFASISLILFIRLKGMARFVFPVVCGTGVVILFFSVGAYKERMFLHKSDSISIHSLIENPGEVIESVSGSGRFAAWNRALKKLFLPRPVIGSGLGAAQFYFYGSGKRTHFGVIHSEYIRLACDTGVIGLISYVFSWAYVFVRLVFIRPKDPYQTTLITAAIGASFSYLIFLTTDNGLDYASQFGNFVYALVSASLISVVFHKRYKKSTRA